MKKLRVPLFCLLVGTAIGIIIWSRITKPKEARIFQSSESTHSTGQPPLKEASMMQISESRQNAITRAVERVSSAVVGINVIQIREYQYRDFYSDDPFMRFFFPELRQREAVKGLGSGFIISPDGYVITNEHVIHGATEIVITLPDKSKYNAELIASDYISDLALLKISGRNNFPYAMLGNSDDLIIGEWAIALGNPFGLFDIGAKPSVTIGIISAVDRDFGKINNDRVYQDMIQTDAAINGGNSGGPLVNSLGEVIGINTFIYSGSETMTASIGVGFAIPVNRVKRVVRDLKQYGEVNRSFWTGLEVEDLNPLMARYLGMESSHGVIISNIQPSSPASKTELEAGDVIVEINGISIRDTRQIQGIIEDLDVRSGDILTLKIYRNRQYVNVKIQLEKIPR